MKINKTIKQGKITSFSITFEDDEEIGCLEDMTVFSVREISNHHEYRNKLPEIVGTIQKELS